MVLLELQTLTKHFGGLAAVQGIDLTLAAGQRQAIIGPNGAGKTTLLNLIMGQLPPTSGHIRFQGRDITGLPCYRRARRGITKTFQKPRLFTTLTVFENVRAAVHVGHHKSDRVGVFSAGDGLSSREALARRRSHRALGGLGIVDGGGKLPPGERLS